MISLSINLTIVQNFWKDWKNIFDPHRNTCMPVTHISAVPSCGVFAVLLIQIHLL